MTGKSDVFLPASPAHHQSVTFLPPSNSFVLPKSIDLRCSADPFSALSNSCGHIAAAEATAACANGGRSGSVNDEGAGGSAATAVSGGDLLAAASGYHSGRRSAFCSGGTSRDHYGRQQNGGGTGAQQMLMFCTASGCSGHPPCVGHRPPPLRSAHSSIDESTGEAGMPGQFRDTYLTEISREWMRMNGAIAPFRNILQQASSVASTPLPNHRPMIQSPAAPAAASAASTASAIFGAKASNSAEEELGSGGSGSHTMAEAIQGSCHNLATVTAAATTDQRIVDQFVRSKDIIGSATDVAGGCGDAVIIIEPRAMSQKRYSRSRTPSGDPLLKKSLSLVLSDDVEAQRAGAVSTVPCGGGSAGGGNAPSEKGGQGSLMMNNDGGSACSAKHSLSKEKERGGRFIKRQQLFNKRRITSDYALFFAIFGIVLMIIENEFVYAGFSSVCVLLKLIILLSTVCLVGLVVKFHVHEIQIFMNANSAEDWQIALTFRKSMQIVVEIIACAICPLPIQIDVYVSTVNSDGHTVPMRMPLDVLFSILMFFRMYWLCRVMLLHSRLFTDAASRSIAGLNRVKTDAKFILKTLMTICPGTMLLLFTASLWMIGGYILRLCERHHEVDEDASLLHNNMHANKHQSYLNSLWLIAVTFLSIGYGDIVPNTQCGRIMAVVTGILGTCTSSMVVAVIARKLELTRAEKHVHNFMIETQHTKQLKHIAANVLRETWLIYKHRCLVNKIEPSKIRHHQRKFLVAICALRKLKTSQRKLDENRISLGDVAKTTSHSHDLMREVQSTQEGLALRITAVEHQLSDIQREVGSIADMLRAALRPPSAPLEFVSVQHPAHQYPPNMELFPVRQRRKPSTLADA